MNQPSEFIFLTTHELSKQNEICNTAYGFAISSKDGIGMGHHLYVLSKERCKQGEYKYCYFTDKITQYDQFANIPGTGWCEQCRKITATNNPKLNHKVNLKTEGDAYIQDVPSIFQSDIEYCISLYNGKGKEVGVKNLIEELYQWSDVHIEGDITRNDCALFVEWFKIKLQDNTDKKFTFENMEDAIFKSHTIGKTFYKENLTDDTVKRIINSLTKEQPKSDTVMVEYEEFRPAFNEGEDINYDGMTAHYKPKLKEGNICIVR